MNYCQKKPSSTSYNFFLGALGDRERQNTQYNKKQKGIE